MKHLKVLVDYLKKSKKVPQEGIDDLILEYFGCENYRNFFSINGIEYYVLEVYEVKKLKKDSELKKTSEIQELLELKGFDYISEYLDFKDSIDAYVVNMSIDEIVESIPGYLFLGYSEEYFIFREG